MPDYWKWSKGRLTEEAEKYNIPPESVRENDPWSESYFDRNRIITTLVTRDTHRRWRWTLLISVFAILISLGALLVSYLSYRVKNNDSKQTQSSQTVPSIQQGK